MTLIQLWDEAFREEYADGEIKWTRSAVVQEEEEDDEGEHVDSGTHPLRKAFASMMSGTSIYQPLLQKPTSSSTPKEIVSDQATFEKVDDHGRFKCIATRYAETPNRDRGVKKRNRLVIVQYFHGPSERRYMSFRLYVDENEDGKLVLHICPEYPDVVSVVTSDQEHSMIDHLFTRVFPWLTQTDFHQYMIQLDRVHVLLESKRAQDSYFARYYVPGAAPLPQDLPSDRRSAEEKSKEKNQLNLWNIYTASWFNGMKWDQTVVTKVSKGEKHVSIEFYREH